MATSLVFCSGGRIQVRPSSSMRSRTVPGFVPFSFFERISVMPNKYPLEVCQRATRMARIVCLTTHPPGRHAETRARS